jgi:hypothetical protein
MTDYSRGNFILFENNLETSNFTLITQNALNNAFTSAYDTAFFQTKSAFITSTYDLNQLNVWSYCPFTCNQCNISNACTSCLAQHYDTGSNTCQNSCP